MRQCNCDSCENNTIEKNKHEQFIVHNKDEYTRSHDYCDCKCHEENIQMIHIQPCCEGKCIKCLLYIKSNLKDHEKACITYINKEGIYIELQKQLEKNKKLAGEIEFLKNIIAQMKTQKL